MLELRQYRIYERELGCNDDDCGWLVACITF